MTAQDKIDRLWDERLISNRIITMARGLDGADWDGFEACFTDPVNVNYTEILGQPEARMSPRVWRDIAQLAQSVFRRKHHLSNIMIDVDGDHATALAYLYAAVGGNAEEAMTYKEYVYYRFWLVRDGADWRIARIHYHKNWIEGDPRTMLRNAEVLLPMIEAAFCAANSDAATQALAQDASLSNLRNQHDFQREW